MQHIPHQQRLVRTAINDIFRVATTKGKLSTSPVTPTRLEGAEVKCSRLSLNEFNVILNHAELWIMNSMESRMG